MHEGVQEVKAMNENSRISTKRK